MAAGLTSHTMGVREITGAAWAVAAATTAALLWSLLDTPPSWDKDFRMLRLLERDVKGIRIQSETRALMTNN